MPDVSGRGHGDLLVTVNHKEDTISRVVVSNVQVPGPDRAEPGDLCRQTGPSTHLCHLVDGEPADGLEQHDVARAQQGRERLCGVGAAALVAQHPHALKVGTPTDAWEGSTGQRSDFEHTP